MPILKLFRTPLDTTPPEIHEFSGGIIDALYSATDGDWPDSARLYRGEVAQCNDVTPHSPEERDALNSDASELWCAAFYPAAGYAIYAIYALAAYGAYTSYKTAQAAKKAKKQRRDDSQSGFSEQIQGFSNRLLEIGQRIPDGYGKNWMRPLFFQSHREFNSSGVEELHFDGVLGRGHYTTTVDDVYNGDAPLRDVPGCSLRMYNPGAYPTQGSASFSVGPYFNPRPPQTWRKVRAVDGAALNPLASAFNKDVNADDDDIVLQKSGSTLRFIISNHFTGWDGIAQGDEFNFANANQLRILDSLGATILWLDQTNIYTVVSSVDNGLAAREIIITFSALPGDDLLALADGTYSTRGSVWIVTIGSLAKLVINYLSQKTPWYLVSKTNDVDVVFNTYASTLFKSKDGTISNLQVNYTLEIQVVNSSGATIYSATRECTIGADRRPTKDQVGSTEIMTAIGFGTGEVYARAWRTDEEFHGGDYQYSQDIVLLDIYARETIAPVHNYGDVTVIQGVVVNNEKYAGLSNSHEIKILATRNLPTRLFGDIFTPTKSPTQSFAEIISDMWHDPLVGGMPRANANYENIYGIRSKLQTVFPGTGITTLQFNYVYDDSAVTAEDMMQDVAQAVFCHAYRAGGILDLHLEHAGGTPRMLLNHSNTMPRSQSRRHTYGLPTGRDGVEFEWVDIADDEAKKTIYLPADRSARKPQRIQIDGIKTEKQAILHAWREYMKIMHSHTSIKIDALREADSLMAGQVFLCADEMRPETMSGRIVAQDGLILKLSQPVNFDPAKDYNIILQTPNIEVQSIACVAGDDEYHIVLQSPPDHALALDAWAATSYEITWDQSRRNDKFILTQRRQTEKGIQQIEAINFDPRYYSHDEDFL